jgi:hypothetical protein
MALSHDTQEQALKAIDQEIATARAFGAARALAKHMINFTTNSDPRPERNAANPAHGVAIRQVVPMLDLRVPVDQACKDHNAMVANLGVKP